MLTQEQKERLVTALATFHSIKDCIVLMREEFDVEISYQDVWRYDPTKTKLCIGRDLQALFEKARKGFLENVHLIDQPIAAMNYRLKRLMRLADKAEDAGALADAAKFYEQAAKEVGGLYTNVRQVEGNVQHTHMTVDEARAKIVAFQEKRQQAQTTH